MWSELKHNAVNYLIPPGDVFERSYKSVRSKEKRWLSDHEVKRLPEIDGSSLQKKEWEQRKWMSQQFLNYLAGKSPKRILEIGCGNGWYTNLAASFCDQIVGLDITSEELEQAVRCFGNEHIAFVCSTDLQKLEPLQFDLIFFAGSLQYLEVNEEFWGQLNRLLDKTGEIHILETRFYDQSGVEEAKRRSKEYFKQLGEEVNYYHHLCWEDLPRNYELLYRPDWRIRFNRKRSSFPWIRIQNNSL